MSVGERKRECQGAGECEVEYGDEGEVAARVRPRARAKMTRGALPNRTPTYLTLCLLQRTPPHTQR